MGCSKSSSKGKFRAIQSYLKNQETSQINNLTLHLKQLEKEEQKSRKVSRRTEIIKIKGSIQEEDITIVSIYAPNIGAPQYIRQMLTAIKGEIDSNTIIVGDFNPTFTNGQIIQNKNK